MHKLQPVPLARIESKLLGGISRNYHPILSGCRTPNVFLGVWTTVVGSFAKQQRWGNHWACSRKPWERRSRTTARSLPHIMASDTLEPLLRHNLHWLWVWQLAYKDKQGNPQVLVQTSNLSCHDCSSALGLRNRTRNCNNRKLKSTRTQRGNGTIVAISQEPKLEPYKCWIQLDEHTELDTEEGVITKGIFFAKRVSRIFLFSRISGKWFYSICFSTLWGVSESLESVKSLSSLDNGFLWKDPCPKDPFSNPDWGNLPPEEPKLNRTEPGPPRICSNHNPL